MRWYYRLILEENEPADEITDHKGARGVVHVVSPSVKYSLADVSVCGWPWSPRPSVYIRNTWSCIIISLGKNPRLSPATFTCGRQSSGDVRGLVWHDTFNVIGPRLGGGWAHCAFPEILLDKRRVGWRDAAWNSQSFQVHGMKAALCVLI